MNHETVIAWYMENLQSAEKKEMPADMQAFLDANPDILDELNTLELFWSEGAISKLPQPSENLKENFYKTLNDYDFKDTAHNGTKQDENVVELTSSKQSSATQWFARAAILLGVFITGFLSNSLVLRSSSEDALQELQQEIANLNTVVAVSMLQQSTASQRIAGAAYSRQANMADPILLDVMLEALASEQSAAVKLALIESLRSKTGINSIAASLIEITSAETQPLIQIALCRLLFERGNTSTKEKLLNALSQRALDNDVEEFLTLMKTQTQI